MSVRTRWTAIVKSGALPTFRSRGFARDGSAFTRRRGSADQRVAFRASQHNAALGGLWILDVGWDLDEAQPFLNTEDGGMVVGGKSVWFGHLSPQRLAGIPREWKIEQGTDDVRMARDLANAMATLATVLDAIDGPRAMLERVDLSEGFLKLKRAQLRFILGDATGALADARLVCEEFADRQGMALRDVLRRSGLSALDR